VSIFGNCRSSAQLATVVLANVTSPSCRGGSLPGGKCAPKFENTLVLKPQFAHLQAACMSPGIKVISPTGQIVAGTARAKAGLGVKPPASVAKIAKRIVSRRARISPTLTPVARQVAAVQVGLTPPPLAGPTIAEIAEAVTALAELHFGA